MVFQLILIYFIIILIDIKDLSKADNRIKSTTIYWILIVVGFIISLLQIIEKTPTSPAIIIGKLIKPVLKG